MCFAEIGQGEFDVSATDAYARFGEGSAQSAGERKLASWDLQHRKPAAHGAAGACWAQHGAQDLSV